MDSSEGRGAGGGGGGGLVVEVGVLNVGHQPRVLFFPASDGAEFVLLSWVGSGYLFQFWWGFEGYHWRALYVKPHQ